VSGERGTPAGAGTGREGEAMQVRCEGGLLDGRILDKDEPEPIIHQSGLVLLRAHRPYPKRKGERVIENLLSYFEEYALHQTPDGPVYRCVAPFGGVTVGDELVAASEGGAFEVWAWRDGTLHARPEGG
jgi:hypothetical protein